MHIGEIPSKGTLYEEMIHMAQARRYGELDSSDYVELYAREVKANRKLLRCSEYINWIVWILPILSATLVHGKMGQKVRFFHKMKFWNRHKIKLTVAAKNRNSLLLAARPKT